MTSVKRDESPFQPALHYIALFVLVVWNRLDEWEWPLMLQTFVVVYGGECPVSGDS